MRAPETKGRVMHWARRYDLLAWLLLLGRERQFRERLVNLASIRPGESVLDVGCGTGTLAIAAARHAGSTGDVHGLDASPAMIARARRKAAKAAVTVAFRVGVVEALPYADARFDVVLSTLMLHHLPRSIRAECAREMRRVLKPGGRVLVVDFGRGSGGRGLISHFHRHGGVDLDSIVELLVGAGLTVMAKGSVGVRGLHYALAAAVAN